LRKLVTIAKIAPTIAENSQNSKSTDKKLASNSQRKMLNNRSPNKFDV
jgi:hypothetical protein